MNVTVTSAIGFVLFVFIIGCRSDRSSQVAEYKEAIVDATDTVDKEFELSPKSVEHSKVQVEYSPDSLSALFKDKAFLDIVAEANYSGECTYEFQGFVLKTDTLVTGYFRSNGGVCNILHYMRVANNPDLFLVENLESKCDGDGDEYYNETVYDFNKRISVFKEYEYGKLVGQDTTYYRIDSIGGIHADSVPLPLETIDFKGLR